MLIEWVAPPECPSEREVVAHVTDLAGETLAAEPLRVRAHVTHLDEEPGQSPERYRLELRVGRETAQPRILENADCRYLADAAAFIVALDLQSLADAENSAPAPEPGASPVSPPERGAPPAASPPPSRKRPRPRLTTRPPPAPTIHGGLATDLRLDHGSLPSFAVGAGVSAFVTYRAFRAELGGALWPPRHATVPGATASITLRTADLRGCWSLPRLSWADACLHVEVGSLRAAGVDVARPATSDGLWVAALAGLTVRPPLLAWGPVRARFTAELGAPLQYPTVTIEDLGRVFRPGTPIVRFGIGIEARLF